MCDACVNDQVILKEEMPFQFGLKAVCMRFVRSGCLMYYPRSDREVEGAGLKVDTPWQYLSEAVLWTAWVHQGLAVAASDTRIVMIEREGFSVVARRHPIVFNKCMDYARTFKAALKNTMLEDLDDLFCAFESKEELAAGTSSKE